jgi:putative flippase GtrA
MNLKKLIFKFFKNSSESILIQFFRYIFVGGVAFFVDFSLLYFLTEFLGLFYILSATISFLIGLIVNYIISLAWVFNKRKLKNRYHEFLVFALIGVIGLGLNDAMIYYFTTYFALYFMFSKIISQIAVLLWNFFARRYVLFK